MILNAWINLCNDVCYLGSPLQPVVKTSMPLINLGINNYTLSLECVPKKDDFYYKWEKRNKSLPSRAQGIHSSNLMIYNVTPEDAGDYRCLMSNNTGAIASDYKSVAVKGILLVVVVHIINLILSIVKLPEVLISPSSIEVDTCSDSVLRCTVNGYGKIKVTWRKLDDELPEKNDVVVKESLNEVISMLTINKLVWYYNGIYYCVANNNAGEVRSSLVTVNVAGEIHYYIRTYVIVHTCAQHFPPVCKKLHSLLNVMHV